MKNGCHRSLGSLSIVLAMAWLVSCNSKHDAGPESANDLPGGLLSVPALSELSKQGTAHDEYLIQQTGADFASDLAFNGCIVDGSNLLFDPSWQPDNAHLSDAAFALFRLTFNPQTAPVILTADWGIPAAFGDCWIGLSNWERNRWDWLQLDATSAIELDDPSLYVDDQERCYVVVLILGDTLSSLARIGFGDPQPPAGEGYTLIAPLMSNSTYLVDMTGATVHSWESNRNPGASAMLLESGHLLRSANMNNPSFPSGGAGGRITEFDWDGNVVWSYDLSTDTELLHHDFARLPSGNLLAIAWSKVGYDAAVAAGRDPSTISETLWAEKIIEIEPTAPSGGNIVWQWNVMDHLIQDFDMDKGNPGDPAQHPELVDINFPGRPAGDWLHINCVAYNAELDQIVLSVPNFNEIWIIDHSTTTAEAAGHSGGLYGRGGDLLYRWGNPLAYRRGTAADQKLFFQHNSHWIPKGLDGAGDILVFNNQAGSADGELFSTVAQITPPLQEDGKYLLEGSAYGPLAPSWEYKADPAEEFFSAIVSSAQRLPGGDTLICAGAAGRNFVVDSAGVVKWEHETASQFRALRYTYDFPGVAALQNP